MAKFERTDKLKIKKEKSDHSLEKREEKKLRKLKNKESKTSLQRIIHPRRLPGAERVLLKYYARVKT